MKIIKRIIIAVMSIGLFFCTVSNVSLAAGNGSIKISSVSGNVGSVVTVNGTVSSSAGALGGARVTMVYDQSGLQFVENSGTGGTFNASAGSITYGAFGSGSEKTFSFSMKFKILKVGAWKIEIASHQVVDLESATELVITSTSGTVTGKVPSSSGSTGTQQPAKDSNNKLSSLQVYPGTLSPSFSASTTEYTVEVPADTTEVTISAKAQSSKATVSVSGGKNLKLGANEARVVVVAENGSSIAYNITIMCGEEEKIQIDGTEHTIDEDFTDEQIPDGFTRTKVTYNSREYEALVHANGKLQLMSLQNDAGNAFYIYNQEKQEFYPFAQVQISEGKYVVILPLNANIQEFANCEKVTITVQEKAFEVWKLDEEFSVAYVLNPEGKEALYRYDKVDGVFQRYTDVELKETEPEPAPIEKTLFPNQYYLYAIAGLGALALILLISMIYFIASRKRRHEGRKRKAVKKAEKKKLKQEKAMEKQRQKEEKEAEKQRQIEEKEAEKQRKIEEKQRKKDEKKRKKQDKE